MAKAMCRLCHTQMLDKATTLCEQVGLRPATSDSAAGKPLMSTAVGVQDYT
jgi:hypothetical protein